MEKTHHHRGVHRGHDDKDNTPYLATQPERSPKR